MFHPFKKQKSAAPVPLGPVEFIVAGLGNPGREYENTRHNAGFLTLDAVADKCGADIKKLKYKSLLCDAEIGGRHVLLMKPQTFMNLSGQAVVEAMRFYKLPPERTIIVFDDISLEPGKLRIRRKGSDGGHNGMKNIIYLSGSDQFPRIKIGVGKKPNPNWDLADWVLSRFTPAELQELRKAVGHAADALSLMVGGGIDKAMNLYNR